MKTCAAVVRKLMPISSCYPQSQFPGWRLFALVLLLGAHYANSSSAGPIVRYSFDGNALDESGLGNHGTIIGNPSFVTGQIDQAILFENPTGQVNATQYVSLPNSASILALQDSSFTFAIRYRSTDAAMMNGRLFGRNPVPTGSSIVYDYNDCCNSQAYAVVSDTNNNRVNTLPDVQGNPSAITTDGNWHWGVGVLDRGTAEFRVYVDTTLVATESFSTLGTVLFSDLSLGRTTFNPAFGARMTAVDDFRLFSRALTDVEIRALPEPSSLLLLGLSGITIAWFVGRWCCRIDRRQQ